LFLLFNGLIAVLLFRLKIIAFQPCSNFITQPFQLFNPADRFKFIENVIGVRGVFQFFGQVLNGPVFVMVAPAPEP
jgi:hypothetical protein